MKRQKRIISTLSIILVLAIALSSAPPALAAVSWQEGEETSHFIGLHSCSDTEGQPLAPTERETGPVRAAPDIRDYTFIRYEMETTHVYSRQHLPYIRGYPDGSVGPEREMVRAEAAMVFHRMFWWYRDSSYFTQGSLFNRNTFLMCLLESGSMRPWKPYTIPGPS